MRHSRGNECFKTFFCCVILLIGLGYLTARGSTWTWNGLGCDDNWSTTTNWTPAGTPSSDNSTTLIFDGTRRLTTQQDVCGKFYFGGLVFSNTAGAFALGGTTNIMSSSGCKSWQFSGSQIPYIRVLTTNPVTFAGSVILANGGTKTSPWTSLVDVACNGCLQLPNLSGGGESVMTKRGGGWLHLCEPTNGVRYACNDTSVGPAWRVEDGVVEMGVRTDRFLFAASDTKGTNWVRATHHTRCSYNLTVGDGIGGATSAVFRLIGPDPAPLLDNNLAVTVNADGLLDCNGFQDLDFTNSICLSVSNGLVRMGGSSLYVRTGKTLDLRGNTRIEGTGSSSVRFFDGATNLIDGMSTCVVLAADAALSNATGAAGVVFQVSGRTGDVAALNVTGHLGAGGCGSHLIKRGPGTMAITNLTHAARTNRVEEGTLLLNGLARCGLSGSGAQWLVLSNATLGGAGTISNASVVVQGGTLDPGDAAVAKLTIESNLVLAADSMLVFDFTPPDPVSGRMNDQIVIQKGVVAGLANAALRLDLHDRVNVDGQRFRIIQGGGDLTGQSFRAVAVTGRCGRQADVITGDGFVDVMIRSVVAGTTVIAR